MRMPAPNLMESCGSVFPASVLGGKVIVVGIKIKDKKCMHTERKTVLDSRSVLIW